MLVDAVLMRFGGHKLSNQELQAATPVRGILTLDASKPIRAEDKPVVYATLTNSKMSEALLPALRHAYIDKLKGNSFIVHGEETTAPKVGSSVTLPQAWWCRLVEDAETVLMLHRETAQA